MQIRPRRAARAVLALSVGALVAAPSLARADWAQFHNQLSRRGATHTATLSRKDAKGGLHEVWGTATGDSAEGINSSPAVVDGTVYVGSDDGSLWAFDASDGSKRWSFPTGGAVRSSPAVVDGVVYVGSNGGSVYAVHAADGSVAWSKRLWTIWHGAAYDDGMVFVGSDQSKLFAFDATTGQQRWAAVTDGRVRCTPSVWHGDVYVGDDAAKVYAFDEATGRQLWASRAAAVDAGAVVRSAPAVGHGRVYVDTGETTPMDGHVTAFDAADGSQLWRMHLADYATSSPALANGVLYLGSYDTRLYAFNAENGHELWTSGWGTLTRGITSSPAVNGAKVYVGVRNGTLYAFGR